MAAGEDNLRFRYLIHYRDKKFSRLFDEVFSAVRTKVIRTPFQSSQRQRLRSDGSGRLGMSAWTGS